MPSSGPTDPSSELQVRIYTSLDEPEIAPPAWNDLLSRSDTNTVFQTHEWMTSWWQAFGAGREMLLIAVFDNSRLVGLAPLQRESGNTATSDISFIADGNADYCDFLLAEPRLPVLQRIIATLASQCDRWHELRLNNLPEHSFTATHIQAVCVGQNLHPLRVGRIVCPAMVFGEPVSAAVSIQRRQSLKRPLHYFQAQGRIEYTELTTTDTALAQLPGFFEQHIARWKDSRNPSLFTKPGNQAFYRQLVSGLLPTGWLVFSVVLFDGKPLAFHFGFAYRQCYYWYKPSYDIAYRRHSPGNLLLRFLLMRAVERRCLEFDFTIGNEAFKQRYSNTTRHNQCLVIFPERRSYLKKKLALLVRTLIRTIAFRR